MVIFFLPRFIFYHCGINYLNTYLFKTINQNVLFLRAKIRVKLSSVVLSQCFSRDCRHDFDGGFSHLKGCLELESSLPRWLTNMPDKLMLVIARSTQLLTADVDFTMRLLNMLLSLGN